MTQMQKHFNLSFGRQTDGTIRLVQSDYCGEDSVIAIHPEQLLLATRQLCGIEPERARLAADLERRLAVLTDKLQDLVCCSSFRTGLIYGSPEGLEWMAKLDCLLDLALEFDGGRLKPQKAPPEPQEGQLAPPKADPPDMATEPQAQQLGLNV